MAHFINKHFVFHGFKYNPVFAHAQSQKSSVFAFEGFNVVFSGRPRGELFNFIKILFTALGSLLAIAVICLQALS